MTSGLPFLILISLLGLLALAVGEIVIYNRRNN